MGRSIRLAARSFAAVAWLGAVATGLFILWQYESRPAPDGAPPPQWPAGSALSRPTLRPTLLLFAHPHCPCTRASLEELTVLMTRVRERLDVHVVFAEPDGVPEGWSRSPLWDRANGIPGVRLVNDAGGAEAERFGTLASGHALLYGTDGALLFSGGLTTSRGHIGDNPGRAAIVALLSGERPAHRHTPVFGCLLGSMTTRSS
jgi:hypothetical protein